ncbi:MAG TPA: GNAT family N-acetyltransferase, partial [Myxococcaceae bacterium]|nr:GNAT family N-acetyltransferase [Myxococcaceae bacterium]
MRTRAHGHSSTGRKARTGSTRPAVRPLTPELWPALEDLFGRAGASNGCWCMYWRIGGAYRDRGNEKNRAAFRSVVRNGPPPGLLALEGDRAVGWCQVTPRTALPYLDRSMRPGPAETGSVWSVSCFFVRRGERGRGVGAQLLAAAIRHARDAGATTLEAYPVKVTAPGSRRDWYTGYVSTFERLGFR